MKKIRQFSPQLSHSGLVAVTSAVKQPADVLSFQPPAISQAGLALIERWEGFSARVYVCPAGYPTVGFGHVVSKAEAAAGVFAKGLTQASARELLAVDVKKYETAVKRLIRVSLNRPQFDALVSFTYNLGGGALQRSTLRMRLNRGDYDGAADEFLKWSRAGGRILKGLLARRKAEQAMFLSALPPRNLRPCQPDKAFCPLVTRAFTPLEALHVLSSRFPRSPCSRLARRKIAPR